MKWKCTSTDEGSVSNVDLDEVLPVTRPNFESRPPENRMRVTWMGHASVLVEMEGITILTDPIFSQRCSPSFGGTRQIPAPGTKRYRGPPCDVKDLPKVDAVVISHNHYDHLDLPSVRQLNERFGDELKWFVPLGLKSWMVSAGCRNVEEFNWWQEGQLPNATHVTISFTPAQHWSARGLHDQNKVLWGSWCVFGKTHRFFFAGDTGYSPNVFDKIGRKYGPFNLAAIPIGAYHPQWFMHPQHVSPEDAVKIHLEVKADRSIGIHWGTFLLGHERFLAPREDLEKAVREKNLESETFFTLNHGQSREIE